MKLKDYIRQIYRIYFKSSKFSYSHNFAFALCFLTQKASEITAATAADIVSDEALSKIMYVQSVVGEAD